MNIIQKHASRRVFKVNQNLRMLGIERAEKHAIAAELERELGVVIDADIPPTWETTYDIHNFAMEQRK